MLLASRQRVLLVRAGNSWRVGAAARTMGYGGPEEPPAASAARRDARERALVETARTHLSRFAPADLEAHLAPLATARVTPRTCHAAVTVTVRSGTARRVLVRCREDDYGDPSHLPEASRAAGTFAAWLAPLVSQVTYLR